MKKLFLRTLCGFCGIYLTIICISIIVRTFSMNIYLKSWGSAIVILIGLFIGMFINVFIESKIEDKIK